MSERNARLAGIALLAILAIAFLVLISLFGSLTASDAARTPTAEIAIAPSATASPTQPLPTPTATTAPTQTPSPTALPTLTETPACPNPATPEPLWVAPVISPTNLQSQTISVTLGRGREVSVTSPAGTVSLKGDFSLAQPVELLVPLVPNIANELVVNGRVEFAPGCFYTLQTRVDRSGNPLVIVQGSASVPDVTVSPLPPPLTLAPTAPAASVTPPPPGTVFLDPFSQVFALNQDTPSPTDRIWLYEASPETPLWQLAQQGAFTWLQTQDGTLNFWTLSSNVLPTPAAAPQYDSSVEGQTVEFVSNKVFACETNYPNPLILGACTEYTDVASAEVIQRAFVESSVLYLVQFGGGTYWVSSNVLIAEPS
jgi:hypothetical protein